MGAVVCSDILTELIRESCEKIEGYVACFSHKEKYTQSMHTSRAQVMGWKIGILRNALKRNFNRDKDLVKVRR